MKTIIRIVVCTTLLAACAGAASYRPDTPMPPYVLRTPSDGYDTPPRFVSGNSPVYPITRRMKGANGHATVDFVITADGTTADFRVVDADYEAFGTHAVIAMRDWRYEPARKDGRAIAVRARYTWQYGFN